MLTPLEITDEAIDVEAIKKIGIGGTFLMDPSTVRLCRTAFYDMDLFSKQDHARWTAAGKRTIDKTASEMLTKRLEAYEKPPIGPEVERALSDFVERRKQKAGE